MNDTSLLVVVVLAIVVLFYMFFRSKRSAHKATLTPRRLAEKQEEEELAAAPKEPEWYLKDVMAGGKIHLSLPKGLEEDFDVVRRDRVVWEDEQIEYDLQLAGVDPDHQTWLNWWTIGVHTHAWLLEQEDYTIRKLDLTMESLAEMRETKAGEIRLKDQTYTLTDAGEYTVFEGGLRPSKDFERWDFRNELGTRMVMIQRKPWDDDYHKVFTGKEVWLRDLTVIRPRAEARTEPPPSE